jgi:hypothetical protein
VKSFSIDCELEYDVLEQTLFLFNIAAPPTSEQHVRCETITPEPTGQFDEFRDATGANRFLRINVAPGRFSVISPRSMSKRHRSIRARTGLHWPSFLRT